MNNTTNYRIFVEKLPRFRVEAESLRRELNTNLNLSLGEVRLLCVYDLFGFSEELLEKSRYTVFGEVVTDSVTDTFDLAGRKYIAVEYLPGQFDQRAASAVDCVRLIDPEARVDIRSSRLLVFDDKTTDGELAKIRHYYINAVESREKDLSVLSDMEQAEVKPVGALEGFREMADSELEPYCKTMGLAMNADDLREVVKYFRSEGRDPYETELRILDTYWSDHCRHTTFTTELEGITVEESFVKEEIEDSLALYLRIRRELGREHKSLCLMDMATIGARYLRQKGLLDDLEVSEENNACSVYIDVDVDGRTEKWLLQFKNETHNHPTEIEPFGGAATCLGGAIRDPLSGRTYVYQAMRVTGAADPTVSVKDTMEGKLPQKKLVREAAHGYSSYGNQIGLATGYVKEVYHPNYVAKRMEIGAVMGAAPRRAVQRLNSDPGDRIILLGGRTGRDGIGGATGSSKAHNTQSTAVCGAEVQKGNAPTERKIQRLFRREEVSYIIKKCNDFGAGGVSVAIGELADGLRVQLDKVPKKYAGLDGTELAISESQERMAVVVAPENVDQFLAYAKEENLEAVEVAIVTEEPRLILEWRGKEIVNLKRSFLDTNGAHQETDVAVEMPVKEDNYFHTYAVEGVADALAVGDVKKAWETTLSDLNVCSQKGLVEMFDGSIGAGSVYMPYGGRYQLTETQSMVAKLPVAEGKCDTVTMMAYGFDPYLSSWSPYHGSSFAVLESVARIVAAGGDYSKIRFTFQEYFRRMSEDPKRWSQPFAALLGAYQAQMKFGLPSIGGKDSMSGSFNEIDVPPTLVSFAVDIAKEGDIITPELKKTGHALVFFRAKRDAYDLPDYDQVMKLYDVIHSLIQKGAIVSAYAPDASGLAAALSKMAFGNKLGVAIADSVAAEELFANCMGSIVAEVNGADTTVILDAMEAAGLGHDVSVIGSVNDSRNFIYKDMSLSIEEALKDWVTPLEKVFPTRATEDKDPVDTGLYQAKEIYVCKNKVAKPKVFIPVFPGTNCEYDSAKAFERAGAEPIVKVFKNQSAEDIRDSVEVFAKAIDQAQMIMFPGGFSAGDEPEGSAKFFATAFRNEKMKEAVMDLLNNRDGLALGICNGFQALIKLGLVPYGQIHTQQADAPTLTYNTIGRHISKMVYTKVVSDKSPWLAQATLGQTYCNPASHGEGRFVASKEWLDKLFANGQVATQYVDEAGNPTMDEEWNVNGSYMAIEGITSPDGRVLGKMAHSERRGESVAINIYGEQDMKIFESGVAYFK